MSPLDFASAIMAYCSATTGSVTSWGRTRTHNTQVGGVEDSAHMLWVAADVTYDTPPLPALRDKLAKRLGLFIVHEGDHDHLQPV
jgi:Peptidase M15